MPVKIVADSIASDNSIGVINQSDLQKIKENFIDEVILQPINGRKRIIKRFSCFVFKSQIDQLFTEHPDETTIKINFGVQLKDVIDCNNRDCSDYLTVVIEAAKEGNDPGNYISCTNIDDHVIIPSFRNDTKKLTALANPCCPSGHP